MVKCADGGRNVAMQTHRGGENVDMNVLENRVKMAFLTLIVLSTMVVTTDCSSRSLPRGALVAGQYNYSPSVIQNGNTRQVWWCSLGVNPSDTSQDTDSIYYESINTSTHETFGPVLVLAETPGAWDSFFTCNPKVIGGVFHNPLGDEKTYTYAMYYVATANGVNNNIGVAFSNDGVDWKKYPQPVIHSSSPIGYGVGQPSLYNADHKAAIQMFYEDDTPTTHHVAAVSTDGVHFTVQGTLTSDGLDPDDPQPFWGDMAYDPNIREWYAAFNRPWRPISTTGGLAEEGQYGIELYKISQKALLTGSSPWRQLAIVDTNATGFESNFIAGFVRDSYGNLNLASYPTIQMYTSVSYPQPSWQATPLEAAESAAPGSWILMPMEWAPSVDPEVAINRYFNGSTYEVTTGWISPNAGFELQELLGHFYAQPLHGATVPFYSCKRGQEDYFVALDIGCEGQRILGKEGYGYSQAVSGLNLVALYRCRDGQVPFQDHFVSKDPKCEGKTPEGLLGYSLP